jgi:hypothetical protein
MQFRYFTRRRGGALLNQRENTPQQRPFLKVETSANTLVNRDQNVVEGRCREEQAQRANAKPFNPRAA